MIPFTPFVPTKRTQFASASTQLRGSGERLHSPLATKQEETDGGQPNVVTGLPSISAHRGSKASDFLPGQIAFLLAFWQPDDVSRWVDGDDLSAATELEDRAYHASSS